MENRNEESVQDMAHRMSNELFYGNPTGPNSIPGPNYIPVPRHTNLLLNPNECYRPQGFVSQIMQCNPNPYYVPPPNIHIMFNSMFNMKMSNLHHHTK